MAKANHYFHDALGDPKGCKGDHNHPPKHRRRIFPWVFLGIQAAFLLWLVLGVHGAATSAHCAADQQLCDQARQAGTAVGAGIIIFLWAAVDVIVGVTWAVIRFAHGGRR